MQEYVIILPRRLDVYSRKHDENVLLVLKNKPDFLKGKLNLVGGKVEYGETLIQAATRELEEESGLFPYSKMTILGKLKVNDYVIYCLSCDVVCKDYKFDLKPRQEETEYVQWYLWDEIKNDDRLIKNLKVIIPLMLNEIKDWVIEEQLDGSLIIRN